MDASSLKAGTIQATVKFALQAEAMKGRPGFRSGIQPNHWLRDRDYTFVGRLEFLDREWLKPGEACTATATLVIAEQDRERFVPGFTWQVGESVRIAGECTLLSIERPYEPLDVAERKGPQDLTSLLERRTDFETFFAEAPHLNPSRSSIKGVICGIRVEDIKEPLMQEIRYLDKLIDELAKGKAMEKIFRE